MRVQSFARESKIINNPYHFPGISSVVDDGEWVDKGAPVVFFDRLGPSNRLANLNLDKVVSDANLKVNITGIDNRLLDLRDQLGAAEDKLKVLDAREKQLLALPDSDEVAISRGSYDVALLDLASASNDLVRARGRYDRNMISLGEFQKVETAYDLAEASREYASRMLYLSKLPASSIDITSLELEKSNLRVQIEKLKEEIQENKLIGDIRKRAAQGRVRRFDMRYKDTMDEYLNNILRSPSDGYVVYLKGFRERVIERGERMWRNSALIRIPDMSKQMFRGVIMESQRPFFSEGDRGWVHLSGRLEGPIAARIESFGEFPHDRGEKDDDEGRSKDYGVKVYDVMLSLEDDIEGLKEGVHGYCDIYAENVVSGVMVPLTYVRVVKEQKFLVMDGRPCEVKGSVVGSWLMLDDESLLGRRVSRFGFMENSEKKKTGTEDNVLFRTSAEMLPLKTEDVIVPDVHGWPKVTWLVPEDTVVTQGMVVARLDEKDVLDSIEKNETLLMEAQSSREARELDLRLKERSRVTSLRIESNKLEIARLAWVGVRDGRDLTGIEQSRHTFIQSSIKLRSAERDLARLKLRSLVSSNEIVRAERNLIRARLRRESAAIDMKEKEAGPREVEVERKYVAYREQLLKYELMLHDASVDRFKESSDLLMVKRTEAYRKERLELSRKTLKNHTLVSPGNGLVRYNKVWSSGSLSKLSEGSQVGEMLEIMKIADLSEMSMRAEVPERYFPHVSIGMKVDVVVSSMGDLHLKGRVEEIDYLFHPKPRRDTERGLYSAHEPLGATVFNVNISVDMVPGVVLKAGAVGEILFYKEDMGVDSDSAENNPQMSGEEKSVSTAPADNDFSPRARGTA